MSDSRFVSGLRECFAQTGSKVSHIEAKALGSKSTVHHWMKGKSPGIDNFEAVLNAMGFTLKIVPLEEKQ